MFQGNIFSNKSKLTRECVNFKIVKTEFLFVLRGDVKTESTIKYRYNVTGFVFTIELNTTGIQHKRETY